MGAFRESFNLLCGEKIGEGIGRKVFVCALAPNYVVKVEQGRESFQNILEWETWNRVSYRKEKRWFAPCRSISPNGVILIQDRTRPPDKAELPKKVPVWFSDLKESNWGMLRGVLVCHDYGTCLALQEGTITKKKRKADWGDDYRILQSNTTTKEKTK